MRGWSSGAGSKAKGSDCSQALGQGSRSPSLKGHDPPGRQLRAWLVQGSTGLRECHRGVGGSPHPLARSSLSQ